MRVRETEVVKLVLHITATESVCVGINMTEGIYEADKEAASLSRVHIHYSKKTALMRNVSILFLDYLLEFPHFQTRWLRSRKTAMFLCLVAQHVTSMTERAATSWH